MLRAQSRNHERLPFETTPENIETLYSNTGTTGTARLPAVERTAFDFDLRASSLESKGPCQLHRDDRVLAISGPLCHRLLSTILGFAKLFIISPKTW